MVANRSNGGRPAVPSAAAAESPSADALPRGTRLGEFEIVDLIGVGGFGIVYLAYDQSLQRPVALKEYMPSDFARRDGMRIAVRAPRHAETFGTGLRSFVNEARLLAQFDHPSLVQVYRFWEANGTAYMAMPYYRGLTLRRHLVNRAAPDQSWLTRFLAQILEALEVIHAKQCYHRDIAPDNIMMLDDDQPVLLDFGAARRVLAESNHALTVILKPGYAPLEQYAQTENLKQGPWTDIYALACVTYFAITGEVPRAATARAAADDVVPLVDCAAGRYSDWFLAAIDGAMSVNPQTRPQNVSEFRDALGFGTLRTHPALRTAAGAAGRSQMPRSFAPDGAVASRESATAADSARAPGEGGRSPEVLASLERLLARYIGPIAKIVIARAERSAGDPDALVEASAAFIENSADRAAFVAAARAAVSKR